MAVARKTADTGEIQLKRIGRAMAKIPVEGLSPLIVNKFSEKAQQIMLDKQMGRATQRAPKDPDELFRNAQHLLADGTAAFPSVGFKAQHDLLLRQMQRDINALRARYSRHQQFWSLLASLLEDNGPAAASGG